MRDELMLIIFRATGLQELMLAQVEFQHVSFHLSNHHLRVSSGATLR